MKYPIGIQDFEKIIEDGYVYLDKTGLVYDLFETLYADRIFHIAAVLNSFGKVTKNNDTSKGIARKKIARLKKFS